MEFRRLVVAIVLFAAGLLIGQAVERQATAAEPVSIESEPVVTGIGGVFFKARDPQALRRWYSAHLGLAPEQDGTVRMRWRPEKDPESLAWTVWGPFPDDSLHLGPADPAFMINFRVSNLDLVLDRLESAGVPVEEAVVEDKLGRFAWVVDPEGNRIELWEPAS